MLKVATDDRSRSGLSDGPGVLEDTAELKVNTAAVTAIANAASLTSRCLLPPFKLDNPFFARPLSRGPLWAETDATTKAATAGTRPKTTAATDAPIPRPPRFAPNVVMTGRTPVLKAALTVDARIDGLLVRPMTASGAVPNRAERAALSDVEAATSKSRASATTSQPRPYRARSLDKSGANGVLTTRPHTADGVSRHVKTLNGGTRHLDGFTAWLNSSRCMLFCLP